MDRDWLLRGRLRPPSYRVALLPTPALMRLDAQGSEHKVVLVTAPAGYGKTALLAQWRASLRASGIRTAWMSLTADQTDPAQLLTYLAMSLIEAGVDLGPVEKLAEQWFADTPLPAAVAAVTGQLARGSLPIVVLVDDVHHLPRSAAEQVFGPLLLPGLSAVHLAMAGRTRAALPLAGMRTRGELLELEADALRFGPRELEALLPDLPLPQREILAARTQGWPVAVQLARLWLTAKPDRVALIAGFSGHTAEVAEYLTEQYLNVGLLDSKIRAFDPNLGVPAAIGNKTPKTVPEKFNLGTQKQWSFTGYKATLRVDFEHRGRKYWDTSNIAVMNAVELLSARLAAARRLGTVGLRPQPPEQVLFRGLQRHRVLGLAEQHRLAGAAALLASGHPLRLLSKHEGS